MLIASQIAEEMMRIARASARDGRAALVAMRRLRHQGSGRGRGRCAAGQHGTDRQQQRKKEEGETQGFHGDSVAANAFESIPGGGIPSG